MHTVKGVGSVMFQLESEVSLKVVGVMNVPRLSGNLLSMLPWRMRGMRWSFEMDQCLYG